MRILITGATDGIGKETARQLGVKGHDIIMVGRESEKSRRAHLEIESEAAGEVALEKCDLSDMTLVRALADRVKNSFQDVDVVINNAAVIRTDRLITPDGFEETFAVNYLAPFLLTHRLLPMLIKNKPSRIVNVSSMVHESGSIDFEDLQSERSYNPSRAYAQSKVALVLFTRELHRRFYKHGISSNALHPGVIRTKLLHVLFSGGAPVERGAENSVYLASSDEVEHISGKYFVNEKPAYSRFLEGPDNKARRLWDISLELLKEYIGPLHEQSM